jgi:hypothetical protein
MKIEDVEEMEKMIDEVRTGLFEAAKIIQNYKYYEDREEADEKLEDLIAFGINKLKESNQTLLSVLN